MMFGLTRRLFWPKCAMYSAVYSLQMSYTDALCMSTSVVSDLLIHTATTKYIIALFALVDLRVSNKRTILTNGRNGRDYFSKFKFV